MKALTRSGLEARAVRVGECLIWRGAVGAGGYGNVHVGGRDGRDLNAHRALWEAVHGPIPPGRRVCHRCDVRLCIRLAHLFVGTQAENMADAARKGRTTRGERNGQARLSRRRVQTIRSVYAAGGTSQRELAEWFGVAQSTIGDVVRGISWREAS